MKLPYRFITCAAILLTSINFAYATQTLQQKTPLMVSYIQTSQSTALQPIGTQQGVFKLTMYATRPYMMYFSDRPNRVTGQISLTEFFNKWRAGKNSFGKDAPNAVLTGVVKHDGQYQPLDIVVELSAPQYDAKTATTNYQVHLLKSTLSLKTITEMRDTTLLVDGACLSCVG